VLLAGRKYFSKKMYKKNKKKEGSGFGTFFVKQKINNNPDILA